MLSGSTILRISLLLVVAGCLAALVQYVLPHAAPTLDAPAPAPATVAPAPRKIATPAPQPSATPPAASVATPAPLPKPEAVAPPPPTVAVPAPVAPPPPPEAATPGPAPARSPPTGQAEVNEAVDTAGPRALALVDINTASLAELNGLRGGGSIGRAIIQRRPYTAIDQLLSKRVLSRATYDKIKDQITVR